MLAWLFNLSRWESPTHRVVRRNQRGNGCKRACARCTAPSKEALAPLRPPSRYPLPGRRGEPEPLMGFMLMEDADGWSSARPRRPRAPPRFRRAACPEVATGNRHRRSLGSRGVRGMGRPGGAGGDSALAAGSLDACRPVFVFILSPPFRLLSPSSFSFALHLYRSYSLPPFENYCSLCR